MYVNIRCCKENYNNLEYTGKYLLFQKFLQNKNFRKILHFTILFVNVCYRMFVGHVCFCTLLYFFVRFGTFWYMSVRFGTFGTFRYVSVRFSTFRYVSVRLGTFRYKNICILMHLFGTDKYVSVHFRTYMYVVVRHRTFLQVYVQFDTIWYVLVGFRIKCPNLNQKLPERTEPYGKVKKYSNT